MLLPSLVLLQVVSCFSPRSPFGHAAAHPDSAGARGRDRAQRARLHAAGRVQQSGDANLVVAVVVAAAVVIRLLLLFPCWCCCR